VLGVALIPGVHTPTEMMRAHDDGAPLLKLFPAPAGGPAYLRSVLGPLPFLKIVPTNGVDASNIAEWFSAGAWAVGLVGPLFLAEDLAAGNWGAIEARAARMRAIAKAA
jgi:2-dehydro-3-deoxyphosphogluconate aldolase/(4S)-4-hydroxy-2-oxoglutarate aldolase